MQHWIENDDDDDKKEEAHEGDGKAIKQKKNTKTSSSHFRWRMNKKKDSFEIFHSFWVSYTQNIFIQLETMKKIRILFLCLVNEFFSVNSMKNEHTKNNSFCYFFTHLIFFVCNSVSLSSIHPFDNLFHAFRFSFSYRFSMQMLLLLNVDTEENWMNELNISFSGFWNIYESYKCGIYKSRKKYCELVSVVILVVV